MPEANMIDDDIKYHLTWLLLLLLLTHRLGTGRININNRHIDMPIPATLITFIIIQTQAATLDLCSTRAF